MAFGNVYRGKKILVTGHTGFKGSWMCQWLLDLGATVGGYSLDVPTQPAHFELLGLEKKIFHQQGDIRDLPRMQAFFEKFRPDIVFHMAAQALVRDSYDDPKTTFDTNVGGTVNVLECIRRMPSIRAAVLIATDKCYENYEWEYGYRENDRLGGKDPYSASKGCAEIVFSSYYRSFFQEKGATRIGSARAGNVIGGGDWAKDRIIPDCVRAWSAGHAVVIRNPDSTRPWQHVLEPLSGYLWQGAQLCDGFEGLNGESFNFGPLAASNQPVRSILEQMKSGWGESAQWSIHHEGEGMKKEAKLLMLNCEKAMGRLHWQPTLNYEESVAMTADWYRSFYSDAGSVPASTSQQIQAYVQKAAHQNIAWAAS